VYGPLLASKIEKSQIARIVSYVTVVIPAVLIANIFFFWKNIKRNSASKNATKKNTNTENPIIGG
jgi:hypothetical protein